MAQVASENPPSSIRTWLAERALRRVLSAVPPHPVVKVEKDDVEVAKRPAALAEPAPRRLVCVDCKAPAPDTHTAHTIIGAKHRWRS